MRVLSVFRHRLISDDAIAAVAMLRQAEESALNPSLFSSETQH